MKHTVCVQILQFSPKGIVNYVKHRKEGKCGIVGSSAAGSVARGEEEKQNEDAVEEVTGHLCQVLVTFVHNWSMAFGPLGL